MGVTAPGACALSPRGG